MNNYLISLVDTDSIFLYKPDQSSFTIEERKIILENINNKLPEFIKFSDNGYYSRVLVLKSKNYVMVKDGKVKYKGSGILASMKEPKFQKFIKDVIQLFLEDKQDRIVNLYHSYVKEILTINDISEYCSKKTVTSKVLNPKRTNEQKVLDALEDEEGVQEGDKVHVYYDQEENLKLKEHWNNDHDMYRLLGKLYKTALIFSNIIDKKLFINYSLKTKRKLLETL